MPTGCPAQREEPCHEEEQEERAAQAGDAQEEHAATVGLHELPAPWLQALVRTQGDCNGRSALFRASKQLAAVVLQHVDDVQLTLSTDREQAADNSQQQQQQQQQHIALQAILAAAPDNCPLRVVLEGGVPAAYTAIPHHHITQLTLRNTNITPQLLQHQLQLRDCCRVRTLVLSRGCSIDISMAFISAVLRQQWADPWIPASLQTLEACEDCGGSTCAAHGLLQLLGPQLTHLTWPFRITHALPLGYSPDKRCRFNKFGIVPNLQRLTHLITFTELSDELLYALAAQPRLTHVTADKPDLKDDHSNLRLMTSGGWQQVEFTSSHTDVVCASRLPLQHIGCLIVHGITVYGLHDAMQQATAKLQTSCPSLQCVPHRTVRHQQLHLSEFAVALPHPTVLGSGMAATAAEAAAALIGVYTSRLTEHNVCLRMQPRGTFAGASQAVACLQQLPPTVTSVWLDCKGFYDGDDSWYDDQTWQQLVAALPSHVTQLVLAVVEWFEMAAMAACTQNAQENGEQTSQQQGGLVVVLLTGYDCSEAGWLSRQVCQLLQEHPERLRVLQS